MHICFIGVGLMGKPMVERLLAANFELTLWNRTRAKAEQFKGRATIADSVESGIAKADVVITMLENGDVVDDVLYRSEAYKALKPNSIVVDMSSIAPEQARQHGQCLDAIKVHYLDAPVSGGTVGAEQGSLSIMAGGDLSAFEACKELFFAMGKPTHIGPTGSGQLAKLANQTIVGITIGAVSEALLLAAKGGANPEAVKEALSGGFAASRILELHGQRMIDRDFEPGATSRVQLKDMRTILNEANAEGLSLPLSQRTYESYLAHVANGREELDHSSLLLELEHCNQFTLDGKSHA